MCALPAMSEKWDGPAVLQQGEQNSSGVPATADIARTGWDGSFVPGVDGSGLARRI
jgi:hypothetical protein